MVYLNHRHSSRDSNSGRQIGLEPRQTPNQKPDLSPEHTRIRRRRAPVTTLGRETAGTPPSERETAWTGWS